MFANPVPLRLPQTLVEPPSGTVVSSTVQLALKFTETGPLELRKETFSEELRGITGAAFAGMAYVELATVNTRHTIIHALMSFLFIFPPSLFHSKSEALSTTRRLSNWYFKVWLQPMRASKNSSNINTEGLEKD
jgi:hypothetical protein